MEQPCVCERGLVEKRQLFGLSRRRRVDMNNSRWDFVVHDGEAIQDVTRAPASPSTTNSSGFSIALLSAGSRARAMNQYPMVVMRKALHNGPRRANTDSDILVNSVMQKKARPMTAAG